MKFDIFFAICQTDVDGYMPDEPTMWRQFFNQVELADELGFGVAWVAETHLSCETQKGLKSAVIPHFKGEIGLNTDILQVATRVFNRTRRIEIGSAIRNILCNGGPIAHAEAVRTFLSLHGLDPGERRRLHLGFAAGRFEFSNRPYGIVPRNEFERAAWPEIKGKIFKQATEVFLRLLRGDVLSSDDVEPIICRDKGEKVEIPSHWNFERLGVIPMDVRRELLNLTIGTHDPETQIFANQFLPVGVFNLSITPPPVIEETHQRMQKHYHSSGGPWLREYMPRTVMVFLDATEGLSPNDRRQRAKDRAQAAWENYWRAMEGTIDARKVEQAVGNALVGAPEDIIEQIKTRYQSTDRLMLWFDFNLHDNELIRQNMFWFMQTVAPAFKAL
jgi:alkanesulfonate monooxygenase SsuD/methylene tetrahydromethanopterin reductase-like flavin-dependent oxidoreductase (luciferase family)